MTQKPSVQFWLENYPAQNLGGTNTNHDINGLKECDEYCFLAVQNSSIGDLVTNSVTHWPFDFDIQKTIK